MDNAIYQRGSYYFVRFLNPKGKYTRKSTGMTEKSEARVEAGRMILRAYRPQQQEKVVPITWDDFLQKLQMVMTMNGVRPTSYKGYATAIQVIRAALPGTTGPHDIGPEEAQEFKEVYLSSGFRRGKAEHAVTRKRSPISFNSYLRHARAIWRKWLKELKVATGPNPWLEVSFVKVDRKPPEAPDEDVLIEFFQFVKDSYPNWEMPILYLQLKCLLGCRLMDLCSVRSDQLRNGAIHLDPEQLKARDFRRVPLPPKMYRALDELKGPEHLWERFPEQRHACLVAQGKRRAATRLLAQFTPRNFADFVLKLFGAFQKATGKKLKSHMLRKRAITLLFAANVPMDVAARMLGMDPQTARRYYLDMDKMASGEMFAEYADKLIPPD